MKTISLFFDEGIIELNYPSQRGTEFISLTDIQEILCQKLDIPIAASMVKLDFEAERILYQVCETVTTEVRPGLSSLEKEILSLLGYEEADVSNAVELVNALVAGQISEELFEVLMAVEGQANEKNPGIEQFLKMLSEQEGGSM